MYRTIDAKFWHDQKITKLSKDAKFFMLYLVTNPHSHLCGLYYLPSVMATHESGLKKSELDTLWHTLSSAGLAYRDDENQVVWVVNMLGYQGRGSKNEAAAAKQLQLFTDSPLIARFITRYPQFHDRVSIGYPAQYQIGTPEQEQEQEQEREQEQEQKSAAKPLSSAAADAPFAKWWAIVPKKVGRQAAEKAYTKAVKFLRSRPIEAGPGSDDPHAFLLERITEFAASPKARGQFCPHPATWLGEGRYDDDPRTWQRGDDRSDPRGTFDAAQQYLAMGKKNGDR